MLKISLDSATVIIQQNVNFVNAKTIEVCFTDFDNSIYLT